MGVRTAPARSDERRCLPATVRPTAPARRARVDRPPSPRSHRSRSGLVDRHHSGRYVGRRGHASVGRQRAPVDSHEPDHVADRREDATAPTRAHIKDPSTRTCAHTDEALLRRQAVYLLGFDGRPQVADWLRAEWSRAGRWPVRHADITGLMEARSASVALASAGDGTYLHDFVDHMADTRAELANLNYWAHWIGEMNNEQTSDAFMLDADTRSWAGVCLLQHLANRLTPDSPHLPLNLYTLHALVASRPSLLSGRPAVHASLAEVLARLASTDCLSRAGRDQLAGLQYALRIAAR